MAHSDDTYAKVPNVINHYDMQLLEVLVLRAPQLLEGTSGFVSPAWWTCPFISVFVYMKVDTVSVMEEEQKLDRL